MSVSLSDLLAPTTLPSTAGVAAPASAKGQDGAFARELAATQVGTGGTSAEATNVAAANVPAPRADVQGLLADLKGGWKVDPAKLVLVGGTNIPPEIAAKLPSDFPVDPAIVQRMQDGTATEQDVKKFWAAFNALPAELREEIGTLAPPVDESPAETTNPSDIAAVQPAAPQPAAPQTDAALTATADSEEIALKIADEKRPYIPPRPDIPGAEQPKVQEGRAVTTANVPAPTSIETQEASTSVKTLFEQIAPRATANVTIATDAAKTTPSTGTQPASVSAPVPAAAQAIANTPHLTSIQGTVTASADAPAEDGSVATPTANATNTAAPAATTTPVTPGAATAAPETALTPPPADGEAVEAAMTALTKDKTDVKAETPQPAKTDAAAPQTPKPEAAATDEPEIAAQKAAEPTAKEVKPELQAKPAEKPVAAEKPAAPDAKVQQVNLPVTDKPVLVDTSVRTVQQQLQSLPAAAIPQIAGEMAARVKQGHTRFEIRLDPPELGRVDVRIEVDADGKVHSRLMVEKSETLDLLKADQRALERALHEAGFKSEQNSLSFSLKDDRGQHQKFAEQRFLREMNASTQPAEEPVNLMANIAYRASTRGPGGIDMRV